MSTCARCGGSEDIDAHTLAACRDREIANLHSLLRSVTRRLENARELWNDGHEKAMVAEIDAVLEALS